jgi:hypothetical protein
MAERAVGPRALDEDAYHDGLAHVIQRDYFPELSELRDSHEFLLADKADDFARKHQIEARKRRRQENAEREEDEDAEGLQSVDAFLNTWTSEDNASFVELQQDELSQRRAADKWGQRSAAWRALEAQKKLLLLENGGPPLALGGGAAVLAIEGPSKEVYDRQLVRAAAEYRERVVDRDNTRLTPETIRQLNSPPKIVDPEKKRKKLSLLVQKNRFLEGESLGGRQTIDLDDFYDVPRETAQVEAVPTVQGFGFVATPQIVPGQVGAGGESPLVSWGRVEGTPQVLPHGGRHFRIPEVPERDRVAQRLSEQKLKRTPARATPVIGSGVPQASPVFSPAGQKLLEEQRKNKSTPTIFKTPSVPTGSAPLARHFPSPARK